MIFIMECVDSHVLVVDTNAEKKMMCVSFANAHMNTNQVLGKNPCTKSSCNIHDTTTGDTELPIC